MIKLNPEHLLEAIEHLQLRYQAGAINGEQLQQETALLTLKLQILTQQTQQHQLTQLQCLLQGQHDDD